MSKNGNHRNGHGSRWTKQELREKRDRAVTLADRKLGVTSTTPTVAPRATGSVEPGTPLDAEKIALIPSPTYDPVRSQGNWAPYRPVPKPVPGIVPSYKPGMEVIGEAQWGATGTPITAGFLLDLGEYNTDLYGRNAVATYEKMRRGDAQVWGTLMAVKGPLQSATWDIEPGVKANDPGYEKAKEVAEFVKDNLFGGLEFQTSTGGWHSESWDQVMWNSLLCLDFGVSVHEDVFRVDGNNLKLRSLVPLLPITFYRWHPEADGFTLLSLEQYGYRGIEFINASVPAEKICRFTLNQEGSNYWGLSLLRSSYPHWYIKNQLYRIDAIAAERNGLGIPVITLGPGASTQDRAAAFQYVTQLSAHEMTGLVLPDGYTFKIEAVTGQPRDLNRSIEHHNRMISTTALAMFMTIGSAPHGSRATAATQHDFFLAASQHLATYIGKRFTNSTIRRLVWLNFGPDYAATPNLIAKNVKMRDFEDVRESLESLAKSGLFVSDLPVRNLIRDEYELPEETDEGVVGTFPHEAPIEPEDEPGVPGAAAPTKSPQQIAREQQDQGKQQPMTVTRDKRKGGQRAQQQKGVKGKPGQTDGAVNDTLQASEISERLGVPMHVAEELAAALADTPFLRTDGDEEFLSDTPTIYFGRHGETEDDEDPEEEIVSSWSDVPLTDKGREQARKMGQRLKGKGITEVYTSGLARSMETAEIIAKIIGAEVIEEYGLRGWRLPWSGESVNSELPADQKAHTLSRKVKDEIDWYEDHPDQTPPGGDSYNRTSLRICDAVDQLTTRAEMLGKPIAAITHSRVLNSLPKLCRGKMVSEEEDPEDGLGSINKAEKEEGHDVWRLTYNAKRLSDQGYHSIGDDIIIAQPRNRSGRPTYKPVKKKLPPGPPSDTDQEAHAAQTSAAVGGTAPTKRGKPRPVPEAVISSKQASQGAKIIHEKERLAAEGFKPSASQERKVAKIPEELQPYDKQDTPLNPTPETQPVVVETFSHAGSRSIKAVVGKKKGGTGSMVMQTIIFPKTDWKSRSSVKSWLKSHSKKTGIDETTTSYRARQAEPGSFKEGTFRTIELNSETLTEVEDPTDDRVLFQDHHGEQAAEELRKHYDGVYSEIVQKITGPLKAKVVAHVAREVSRQLKAGVPVPELQFTPDHSVANALDALVEKMWKRASAQAKKEVQIKKRRK